MLLKGSTIMKNICSVRFHLPGADSILLPSDIPTFDPVNKRTINLELAKIFLELHTSVFDRMFIRFLLQKIQSSEEELLLRSVDLDTTGLYRCEISGEAPLFQTASREAVLAVVGKIFSGFLK